jgi:hypothetical protein
MFRLDKIYRTNYLGESVTVEARQQSQNWTYKTEWVPISVLNRQTARTACIIGNGNSRVDFPTGLVLNHMSGVLGRDSMQTYGCNALYRDSEPTFLVATGNEICEELANSGYCDDHIVYANASMVLKYPGKFYLIPQDVPANAGTVATYLACFDGHEKIYLLGFDGWSGDNYHNNVYTDTNAYGPNDTHVSEEMWVRSLSLIMQTYDEVEFIRVMPTDSWRCPTEWKQLPNFTQIDWQSFIMQADL